MSAREAPEREWLGVRYDGQVASLALYGVTRARYIAVNLRASMRVTLPCPEHAAILARHGIRPTTPRTIAGEGK